MRNPPWLMPCCLVPCLVWLMSSLASAGSGSLSRLPPPGTLNTSGVQMLVDSRWVDANGYRPVRVEIFPLKSPAPADRQFRVVVKPQSYMGSSRDAVSQIVELEQGALSAKASIPVPQDLPWHSIIIEVYEDGQLHDDLSGDPLNWPRGNYWNWNEATPCILAVDSRAPKLGERESLLQVYQGQSESAAKKLYDEKLPDIRNLIRRFPDNQFTGQFVPEEESRKTYVLKIFDELKDTVKSDYLHPAELPERWIELSSFDLIIFSLQDLTDLAKQRPKTLRAIADWVRAGQTLIVYNTGKEFKDLAQLEEVLQLPPRPSAETAKFRGWREPHKRNRGDELRTLMSDGRYNRRAYTMPTPVATQGATTEEPGGSVDKNWAFVIRPAGLGNVMAFADDPFPGNKRDWNWALNSLPGDSWNPTQRTGSSQQQRNEDFWNFLIPGIGQAPVLSFLVFITLFVVIIGPVNYYVLQARRRLYMLLVTVPVGAFLVTLGLFVYAMFTDGLGVKSRVRSYTALDQRAGVAATTSRQAYYASMAPSRGLMFQDDTVVLPFLHEPTFRNGQRSMHRAVSWSEHEQQLRSGYLSSRTLSQLLVTKSAATTAALKIGVAKGDKLTVTNNLETKVDYLLVKDEDGTYFVGKNVKPGEAELTKIDPDAASTELGRRLNEFRPAFPDGYDENLHDTNIDLFSFGSRYYNRWGNSQTSQAQSLLERNLVRFANLSRQPLEPKSYVALAATNPFVPMGTTTRQYGSLHVIEGNY
ncbi:tripartite tricarboxylate transporter TctB family protein [Anatilimnocola floriformis]|uniref:tripartite tricarboxylate transporter TctB family protein n=1 Tax=Anatilimnocola floriformis TaxID=2948575 RepID=UPI0020C3993D|nr:tripartite tricarboxylate transporter TctB family protein [Anatilimnocola floriformis]